MFCTAFYQESVCLFPSQYCPVDLLGWYVNRGGRNQTLDCHLFVLSVAVFPGQTQHTAEECMTEANKAPGHFTSCNSQLLVSILTVIMVQDSQFTIDKIRSFPLCVQEKQTHRAGRFTPKPPSCLMLLHQRECLQCLTEGSHHHRIKWISAGMGRDSPGGLLGAESPRHHIKLWLSRWEKGGIHGQPQLPVPHYVSM